ncbi:unnamed protein product, partial [Rotaria magnacalcarata]
MAKSLSNKSIASSSDNIERKAINSAGSIGSLYDASRDRLISEMDNGYQGEWSNSSPLVQ